MTANDKAILAGILESAAMVVCTPSWHGKHSLATASNGRTVRVLSKKAACFCAIGAIRAAASCYPTAFGATYETTPTESQKSQLIVFEAVEELRKVIFDSGEGIEVSDYNDAHSTTGVMMAEKMWQAAQNLRSENANS